VNQHRAWGIGVNSRIGAGRVRELARLAESLGYSSFWFNAIGPEPDPVHLLEAVSRETNGILIGAGVVPLDVFPPLLLRARMLAAHVDWDRVIFGLGSGAAKTHPLGLVKSGLECVQTAAPGARLAVGGTGPRMLQLGTRQADALVLSMVSPARARWVRTHVETAAHAEMQTPTVYLYYRVTSDRTHGAELLTEEMISHGAWPAGSRRRPAPDELLGGVGATAEQVSRQLDQYPSSWCPVLRPLVTDDAGALAEEFRRFAPASILSKFSQL
jgi:alkanesulfonate monooxygenase SsuD/methylene tetrahydromethanopterin reductase-like flavin-dependent oxidoreductase (luciferase family)